MKLIKTKPIKVGENKILSIISTCYFKEGANKMKSFTPERCLIKKGRRKEQGKFFILNGKQKPRN